MVTMPLGMAYAGQPLWGLIYTGIALAAGTLLFLFVDAALSSAAITVLQIGLPLACAIHAVRLAVRYEARPVRPWYTRWYGLFGIAALLVCLVAGFRAFIFEPFRFPSGSMLPSITPDSNLVVQKWGYGHYGTYGFTFASAGLRAELKRGDIIVFEFPQKRRSMLASRVLGLPGDRIAYLGKRVIINGKPVETRQLADFLDAGPDTHIYFSRYREKLEGIEYEVAQRANTPSLDFSESRYPFREQCVYKNGDVNCRVPPGHFFVLGDSRDNSMDSRYFGFVPADHVVGRVVRIIQAQETSRKNP